MAEGAPELPPEKPLEQTGGDRKADPLKKEKERLTRIKRIYGEDDDSKKWWVDIEVIDNATLGGAQWPGLEHGRQPLDTIIMPDNRRDRTGRIKGKVRVGMNVLKPDEEPFVELKCTDRIEFSTKGGQRVQRFFKNTRVKAGSDSPDVRRVINLRVQCNNIDEEYMIEDPDDSQGYMFPQPDPKKYRKSVYDTDDEQSVWLDVQIPIGFLASRGLTLSWQRVEWARFWKDNPTIRLPGIQASPKEAKDPIVLDPYQAIVNFGPDSLAVEFFKGLEGPPEG